MKYIKVLGLAAIAATALIAFVGASSASATVLCTENITPCSTAHPTGKMYIPGDIIKGTAENPELTNDIGNVTCTHSETEAKITKTGSATENVTGEVTALTFTGCIIDTLGTPSCTVTVENLPYHAEVVGAGGNGTLKVKAGPSGKAPGASITCASVLNCTFSNTLFELPVEGGNPASIIANQVSLTRSGLVCPKEAFWDATYTAIGTNTAVWVVKE